MQILQITDPHLYGSATGRLRGVETDSSLHAVLDDAFARVPDYAAVLVTGDLVQDDPSGYLRFRSIFGNLQRPVLCIPGNHDEPEAMRRELAGAPFQYCGTPAAGLSTPPRRRAPIPCRKATATRSTRARRPTAV